jgi:putative membrane protein
MMGWYQDGMGWGGWIVMSLVMVAFWALVVFAVVAIFRGTSASSRPADQPTNRDPMQILEERFARGEIDAEEFHDRADVLRTGTRPGTH